MKHPMQPVERVGSVLRFKENKIVSALLNYASLRGYSLNEIACGGFSIEDQRQLAQLIGYSVDGYCDLSYSDPMDYDVAIASINNEKTETEVRLELIEEKLNYIKNSLIEPIADLFDIHPDDLRR